MWKMHIFSGFVLLSTSLTAFALPEPTHDSAPVNKSAGNYLVDGIVISKICFGGHFYLVTRLSNGAGGITPALLDGKPESCVPLTPPKRLD